MGPTAKTVRDVVTRNSAEPDPCSPALWPRSQSLIIFKQATWTGFFPSEFRKSGRGRHINSYCAGMKTQVRIYGTFIKARSSHVLICNLRVPTGRQELQKAHRLASLEYTEGIKQQRDPTSNKMDSEDQLLRLPPHTSICTPWHIRVHIPQHECP